MSPPRIGRSAAVAALTLALAACGDGSKSTEPKHELAPVPAAKPKSEPAPQDAYSKNAPPKDALPAEPAPTPPPKDAMPKAPSMGDPPVAPDPAIAAHHEFEDAVTARLKAVDTQITQLADKIKSAAEDQKQPLQKLFDDLSAKRDEAATKLDQIKTIASDKWDTAKAELDRSVASLESAAAEALK